MDKSNARMESSSINDVMQSWINVDPHRYTFNVIYCRHKNIDPFLKCKSLEVQKVI